MSILINEMEMPETCDECNFHRYHSGGEYVCVATPMLYPFNLANSKGIRKDWCPLIEVPAPHGDLIDRQTAINTLCSKCTVDKPETCSTIRKRDNWCEEVYILQRVPSAQSEIIRCKDCKHYKITDNRAFGFPVKRCKWTGFEDVDDDDFCSRAERRTDE